MFLIKKARNYTYEQKVGIFGEKIALKYLNKKGYKIIDKNVKVSYKEIDLIFKKSGKIIFVEVKTRLKNDFTEAADALNQNKLKNLKKAVSLYVNKLKINPDIVQLDLVAIDIDKNYKMANIKHFENIF